MLVVTLKIPEKNLKHENHDLHNLRDYIKSAVAEMGGCQDPDEHPYFYGLRNITVTYPRSG